MSEQRAASSAAADLAADSAADSVIATTGRLAWATSAFAFSVGGTRFVSPQGEALDAILGIVVGGGAAYLALALHRVPRAVVGAARIALVAGIANGLMLPVVVVACVGGMDSAQWLGVGASDSQRILVASGGMLIVLVAVATPWCFYWALRSRYARRWFAGAGHLPAGLWAADT
ncbi:hypothetical protein [Botrimarina hoheduenensis]|uniref:Uncharacterized protein n=1 Tax=Botrimarina hoheduenensis TaxID=2528000 RepID=A0A5C5VZU7_9BACT|nr:hypothetical protein [Botrimarina hoheduenensis]TWT43329.1 hypothetical protein Pla111_22800 [Botrimarina hoheduenensis]